MSRDNTAFVTAIFLILFWLNINRHGTIAIISGNKGQFVVIITNRDSSVADSLQFKNRRQKSLYCRRNSRVPVSGNRRPSSRLNQCINLFKLKPACSHTCTQVKQIFDTEKASIILFHFLAFMKKISETKPAHSKLFKCDTKAMM